MIVVTAATGQIGKALVEELLSKKQSVRALARDPKKLEPLAQAGAEVVALDLSDAAATARAFQGAAAVFTLIPPKYDAPDFRSYYNHVSEVYASAIRAAGVTHVVNLSSLGAHLPDKTGPIKGLYDHEQRLNRLAGVNILHLRPAYFMENQFFSLGLIKSQGINGSPIQPEVTFPMIATVDIAHAAAESLMRRDFQGHGVRELLGPRDYSLVDVTKALGAAIGKPELPYVVFPYEGAYQAMVGMGLSPDVANLFNEMYRAFNDGILRPTQPRSDTTTTSTTLDDFAKVFAAVYKSR
jgi:uncharacterized protein YbjT (DUF2867 family)